jgi:hypothetical protein
MRRAALLRAAVVVAVLLPPSAAHAQGEVVVSGRIPPGPRCVFRYNFITAKCTTIAANFDKKIRDIVPAYLPDHSFYCYETYDGTRPLEFYGRIWKIEAGTTPKTMVSSIAQPCGSLDRYQKRPSLIHYKDGSRYALAMGVLVLADLTKSTFQASPYTPPGSGWDLTYGVTSDPRSGGWIVYDSDEIRQIDTLRRVSPTGAVVSSVQMAHNPAVALATDLVQLDAYFADQSRILRISTRTGNLSTLVTGGTLSAFDVAVAGGYVVSGATIGSRSVLALYDRSSGALYKTSPIVVGVDDAVAPYDPPVIWGEGPCSPGSIYQIRICYPQYAGQLYQLAASLDYSELRIGPHTVRLAVDPLFWLSITSPSIFAYFSGTVSATGYSQGFVVIPKIPQLAGIVVYAGGIICSQRGEIWRAIPTMFFAIDR